MNPYDAINNDTKENNDTKINKQSKSKSVKKASENKRKPIKKSKLTAKGQSVITPLQKKRLGKIYSTDRINMYVLLHLKALQIISGDKSRSDLEEKMIRIVEPKIINSTNKRAKYNKLLKYAVKGVELKNKMK